MTPQDLSAPADDPPPPEPEPPGEGACCGNGCDPCVWDFYEEERARWAEAMRAWRARRGGASDSLR
jgi:hypothetical protein